MTKTLKDLFEVYKPKSPDEQKFVDKHVAIKHKDRNGNGDDVFKGNTKTIKRKEERHGYDSGEDEKVYEEVEELDELSTKTLDSYRSKARGQIIAARNKDPDTTEKRLKGYTKASQNIGKKFVRGVDEETELEEKKLTPAEMKKREEIAKAMERENPGMDKSKKMAIATATAKRVAEEAEDIEELSGATLGSYVVKSKKDETARKERGIKVRDEIRKQTGMNVGTLMDRKLYSPTASRSAGQKTAMKKLTGQAKVNATEEVEQVNELSTKKLLDYMDKASDARRHRGMPTAKLDKRYKSVMRAGDKMNKGFSKVHATEEVEELEELSNKTLSNYAKKAVNQTFGKGVAGGAALASSDKDVEAQGHQMVTKAAKRMAGAQKAIGKLTKEQVIDKAIEKFMPELEDYVPMTQEEKFRARLAGLSESHVRTLTNLYHRLNEDNQVKMISAIDTPEGVASMLDFALENRGE